MSNDVPDAAVHARAWGLRGAGFTLIELMIVVTVVGILAAIAIPSYQRFDVRTKVSEAHSLARSAQLAVADAYLLAGEFPANNAAAGLGPPETLRGRYVASVTVLPGGVVRATFGVSPIEGETLSLRPRISGVVRWVCSSSLPVNYLPSGCTSENADTAQAPGDASGGDEGVPPAETPAPPDDAAGADAGPFDEDTGDEDTGNEDTGRGRGDQQNDRQNRGQDNRQDNRQDRDARAKDGERGAGKDREKGKGPPGSAQSSPDGSGTDGGWYNDGFGGEAGDALGSEGEGNGRGRDDRGASDNARDRQQGAGSDRGTWGRAGGNAAFGFGQILPPSPGRGGADSSAGNDRVPDEDEQQDGRHDSGRRFNRDR